MTYLKVKWIHSSDDEPVWLYSELDEQRWEIRKVEIFWDSRVRFADQSRSNERTELSYESIPSIAEIAADPQFQPVETTFEEFEALWQRATWDVK